MTLCVMYISLSVCLMYARLYGWTSVCTWNRLCQLLIIHWYKYVIVKIIWREKGQYCTDRVHIILFFFLFWLRLLLETQKQQEKKNIPSISLQNENICSQVMCDESIKFSKICKVIKKFEKFKKQNNKSTKKIIEIFQPFFFFAVKSTSFVRI